MATASGISDGWQTVMPTHAGALGLLSRAQVEEHERQTLREWQSSTGDWSGLGKHISATDHPDLRTRVHTRFRFLENLAPPRVSEVQKVHYTHHPKKSPICLARKKIRYPSRYKKIPMEILRAEAEVMQRLDHHHVIKLIGTYSIRPDLNELYMLVWPVAVCDLSEFLEDVDALRNGNAKQEYVRTDIHTRFEALNLPTTDLETASGTPGHINLLRQIMGCITQATAYCHSQKVRHLDLKPANILLGPGQVYLADFGIAKDVEDRDSTRTIGRIGTPKWQASEVLIEKDEWSMKAADVYALGLVLLSVAAVLYNGNLSDLDQILSDMDPESRADGLERYQQTLAGVALASQEYRNPDDHTVAPRHILELTSSMTCSNPTKRPPAAAANVQLVGLGGLEQVYHAPCCKKSTRYLEGLVDTRAKIVSERCRQLQEENLRNAKRIKALELSDEMYLSRLENAEKQHAKHVENLQRLLNIERDQRKLLEHQLADLQRHGARRAGTGKGDPGGSQLRYNPGPRTHDPSTASKTPVLAVPGAPTEPRSMLANSPVRAAAPATEQTQDPRTRPGVSFAGAAAAGAVATRGTSDSSPKPGLMSRRTNSNSKLPVAINPATPIRSRAHTPNLNRDLSLTDSTQNSMTSSTRSRLSIGTKDTSVAPSPSVGGNSPAMQRNQAAAASNSCPTDSGAGLGINGYSYSDSGAQHIGETSGRRQASATGALSPVLSSSAMSSPRTMKAELASEPSPRLKFRVPGLPTAPSWAEIARKDQQLRV